MTDTMTDNTLDDDKREQAKAALAALTADDTPGKTGDAADAREPGSAGDATPAVVDANPEPADTPDDDGEGDGEAAPDDDADGMRTDAGRRALNALRGQVKTLRQENTMLREQVERFETERHEARVARLAEGRLQYPQTAVRLLDGITRDSSDADIIKALDRLVEAMPGLGTGMPGRGGVKVGTGVGDLISRNTGDDGNANAAYFAAQMSGMGH